LIPVLLLVFLVITAFAMIRIRDLFAAVMLSGIFSLLSAGLYTVMDAVDVAFTEAAVGAGISSVLMVATLAFTSRREKPTRTGLKLGPLAVALVTGGLLIYGTLDLPGYGDPDAPIHGHMAPRFLEKSATEVGPPNMVTSILASYRGYDTFGETTVIFTAAVGVLLLLGGAHLREVDSRHLRDDMVLRVSLKVVIAFLMLFALYVQFHGDYGPGGGFQAGVIFAAAIILYTLVFGLDKARSIFRARPLEAMVAGGVLLYGSVGLVSMFLGGNFLDYDALAHDPVHGQHLGINLVELGVGVTVTAVMTALYFLFAPPRGTSA
jgi:multicomponent Na+:H+ antiporter subunit B